MLGISGVALLQCAYSISNTITKTHLKRVKLQTLGEKNDLYNQNATRHLTEAALAGIIII